SIGGSLTGTVTAYVDDTDGSGSISGVSVTGDLSGSIGSMSDNPDAGTVTGVSVGGDLSGTMGGGSVDGVTVSGDLSGSMGGGSISTITVGDDMTGTITAQGAGTIDGVSIGGSLTGTVTAYVDDTDGSGSISGVSVAGDLSGSIMAESISRMTVTGALTGQLNVTGFLSSLIIGGAAPGNIVAGQIGTIEILSGSGLILLRVTENGIQRRIETETPGNPYPQPSPAGPSNTVPLSSPASSPRFQVLYESAGLANPQATIQVSNGSSSGADSYDLSLLTYNDLAKFNLARLDSLGPSGLANVTVEGDVLTSVSGAAAAFFSGDRTPAGIHLPQDDLIGIGVRDYAPSGGYLQARSLQGLAVGSLLDKKGSLETGQNASAGDMQNLLSSDTQLAQANGTFRVPFADLSNQQVALFLVTDSQARAFDHNPVNLSVQSLVSANADGTANVVQQSNKGRGAAVALISVSPTLDKNGRLGDSEITGIAIRGDGASITTRQPINGPIVSTGSLGDVNLQGAGDIGDITAASIFGGISPGNEITGTIQTTGLWTDPVTGLVSSVAGDFGRVYLDNLHHLTVSSLSLGHEFAGSLLVAGDLLSQVTVNGGLGNSSAILVGGNLGTVVNSTVLGGLTINGGDSGVIGIGGSVFADIRINGGLNSGASIASGGSILGNLGINGGLDKNSSVVARGIIGNPTTGTSLSLNGNNQGIIAARGAIQFSKFVRGSVFNAAAATDTPSAVVIDAIFTDDSTHQPLQFSTNPLELDGLSELLFHLSSLKVKNGRLSLG
ncbi:MAG TPA: hypothetical protein VFT74_16725, partial [Isosphaeraceae bacterium]|nr:hypothetical protein [Isosphaeraceae bacterium]